MYVVTDIIYLACLLIKRSHITVTLNCLQLHTMFKLERLKFMTNEERYNMQNVGSNENLNILVL